MKHTLNKDWLVDRPIAMDCGTCPTAEVVSVQVPKTVDCTVSMTDGAVKMLREAFGDDRESALLVGVLSGGCSGFMYDLQIVESTDIDCQEHDVEGFRVLIPNHASNMLDGIEIDYVNQLMGGGFKINNPNADRTCGCGESFG